MYQRHELLVLSNKITLKNQIIFDSRSRATTSIYFRATLKHLHIQKKFNFYVFSCCIRASIKMKHKVMIAFPSNFQKMITIVMAIFSKNFTVAAARITVILLTKDKFLVKKLKKTLFWGAISSEPPDLSHWNLHHAIAKSFGYLPWKFWVPSSKINDFRQKWKRGHFFDSLCIVNLHAAIILHYFEK